MSGITITTMLALLPAMIGPLSAGEGDNALLLALCGGGQITIQIDRHMPALPGTANTPCCAKGCRNGGKRRLVDLRR